MSLGDSIYYITFGNPISQALLSTASDLLNSAGIKPKHVNETTVAVMPPTSAVSVTVGSQSLWSNSGNTSWFVRVAGLSGAVALIMSAYGKNMLGTFETNKEFNEAKTVLEYASRAHLTSSILLVAMPLTHRPFLSGSLLVCGTTLYCSVNYYRAFTGDDRLRHVAILGGICLTLAWVSMIF